MSSADIKGHLRGRDVITAGVCGEATRPQREMPCLLEIIVSSPWKPHLIQSKF